jgi:hypothetical protein
MHSGLGLAIRPGLGEAPLHGDGQIYARQFLGVDSHKEPRCSYGGSDAVQDRPDLGAFAGGGLQVNPGGQLFLGWEVLVSVPAGEFEHSLFIVGHPLDGLLACRNREIEVREGLALELSKEWIGKGVVDVFDPLLDLPVAVNAGR